jgi:uncharacterized protein YdhG (YjbR/CyaY superfamily)
MKRRNKKMANMNEKETSPRTIDEYIAQYPPRIQELLQAVRDVIRTAAPEAQEKISWSMPTFALYGNLVHFAGHKNHIGFYPGASGIETFKDKLQGYQWSKGAVQFPYSKPIPYDLIAEIVRFRVDENTRYEQAKRKNKKAD